MPAKPTAKSNVAKKSTLGSSKKLNAKVVSIFVVALVAVLGFLYVFLSHAGSQKEFVYFPGYYDNNLTVDDAITGQRYKSIALPAYPAQSICTTYQDGTKRFVRYRQVVALKSLNLAFVLPEGCGDSSKTDDVLIPSINTQTHTYTGKALPFKLSGGYMNGYANEQKKLIYLYNGNDRKITIIDGATSTLLKTFDISQTNIFPSDMIVSADGSKVYVFYTGTSNTPLNNIVAYDAVTGVQVSAGKYTDGGFASPSATDGRLLTLDPGSSMIYAVGQIVQANGNTQMSQFLAVDTSNYANSKTYQLPGGYTSITDIKFARGKVYMVAHKKAYDWTAPSLLVWDSTTKAFFTTVPGAALPENTRRLTISQDPTRMYVTSYNMLRQYVFDTGQLIQPGVGYGEVVLGNPITTTTPTAVPTTPSPTTPTPVPPSNSVPPPVSVPPTTSTSTSTDPIPQPATKVKQ